MKKLLYLILLISGSAFAQIPAANDTTLYSGTTAFTPQFRFKNVTLDGVSYRIPQVYNSLLAKYDTYVTTKYLRAFYAPIVSGGYVPYTGATANVVLGAYDMSAQSYAISGTGGLGYINMPYGGDDSGGSAVPTPAGGVNVYSRGNNYFGWKGTNGYSVGFLTQFFTGNNAFILPNLNGKTIATIDGGQTFTSPVFVTPSSDYLKLTANIVSATTPTGSQIVLGRGVGANTFGFVGANGFSANFSAGGLTSAHTYTLPDVSGGTIALTNTDNAFITPQTMSGLTISGTAGAGIINLAQQTSGTIPTPSSALNIYAGANNTFIAKTTTGFSGSFSYNSITANRTYTLPDAQITIAGKEIDNTFSANQSMPALNITGTGGNGYINLLVNNQASVPTPSAGANIFVNSSGALVNWKNAAGLTGSIGNSNITAYRTLQLPDASGTALLNDNTATVTNKSIDGGSNTITGLTNTNLSGSAGITNANLANSAITLNGTSTSLGGSFTVTPSNTDTTSTGFATQAGIANMPKVVARYALSGKTNVGTLFTYNVPADGFYKIEGVLYTTAISTNTYRSRLDWTNVSGTAISLAGSTISTVTGANLPGSTFSFTTNTIMYAKTGTTITLSTENVASGGSQTYDVIAKLVYYP